MNKQNDRDTIIGTLQLFNIKAMVLKHVYRQLMNGNIGCGGSIVQWGLEYRTFKFRIHSKTELFKVRFSNGIGLFSKYFISYGTIAYNYKKIM